MRKITAVSIDRRLHTLESAAERERLAPWLQSLTDEELLRQLEHERARLIERGWPGYLLDLLDSLSDADLQSIHDGRLLRSGRIFDIPT
jgi:hypothetical protein